MAKRKKTEPQVASTEELQSQLVPMDQIILTYATPEENPNRMDKAQYRALVEMVRVHGFLQPVLLRRDPDGALILIDGHHRYHAVKEVGNDTISAVISNEMDPRKARAIGIGLNRNRGNLNLGLVSDVARELMESVEVSLTDVSIMTGFDEKEIAALLDTSKNDDMTDELPDSKPVQDNDDIPLKPFVLEVYFADKSEYQLCKRKLKKAGGGDLGRGLMSVLGETEA